MQRAVFNKHTSSRINFPFKQQDQRLKKKKKKGWLFLANLRCCRNISVERVNPAKRCSGLAQKRHKEVLGHPGD